MNGSDHFDVIDMLIGIGIFASFVVFGVCMWLLKREMNKKKAANQKDIIK
jgi:heme A synthase